MAPVFLYFFISRLKFFPHNVVSLLYLSPIFFLIVAMGVARVESHKHDVQLCQEVFLAGGQPLHYNSATHTNDIVTNINQCN